MIPQVSPANPRNIKAAIITAVAVLLSVVLVAPSAEARQPDKKDVASGLETLLLRAYSKMAAISRLSEAYDTANMGFIGTGLTAIQSAAAEVQSMIAPPFIIEDLDCSPEGGEWFRCRLNIPRFTEDGARIFDAMAPREAAVYRDGEEWITLLTAPHIEYDLIVSPATEEEPPGTEAAAAALNRWARLEAERVDTVLAEKFGVTGVRDCVATVLENGYLCRLDVTLRNTITGAVEETPYEVTWLYPNNIDSDVWMAAHRWWDDPGAPPPTPQEAAEALNRWAGDEAMSVAEASFDVDTVDCRPRITRPGFDCRLGAGLLPHGHTNPPPFGGNAFSGQTVLYTLAEQGGRRRSATWDAQPGWGGDARPAAPDMSQAEAAMNTMARARIEAGAAEMESVYGADLSLPPVFRQLLDWERFVEVTGLVCAPAGALPGYDCTAQVVNHRPGGTGWEGSASAWLFPIGDGWGASPISADAVDCMPLPDAREFEYALNNWAPDLNFEVKNVVGCIRAAGNIRGEAGDSEFICALEGAMISADTTVPFGESLLAEHVVRIVYDSQGHQVLVQPGWVQGDLEQPSAAAVAAAMTDWAKKRRGEDDQVFDLDAVECQRTPDRPGFFCTPSGVLHTAHGDLDASGEVLWAYTTSDGGWAAEPRRR